MNKLIESIALEMVSDMVSLGISHLIKNNPAKDSIASRYLGALASAQQAYEKEMYPDKVTTTNDD